MKAIKNILMGLGITSGVGVISGIVYGLIILGIFLLPIIWPVLMIGIFVLLALFAVGVVIFLIYWIGKEGLKLFNGID